MMMRILNSSFTDYIFSSFAYVVEGSRPIIGRGGEITDLGRPTVGYNRIWRLQSAVSYASD